MRRLESRLRIRPRPIRAAARASISLVSKSGTNKFHGDVFGVFRPDALSANDYFTKQGQLQQRPKEHRHPGFHRYQEGGAIGGPIKKDKLFFFADYEDTQQQAFEGVKTYAVPTSAERTGDFSALLNYVDPVNGPSPIVIYDPTQPDVGGLRQPFPGNKITNPNPIGLLYLVENAALQHPRPHHVRSGNVGC